MSTLPAGLASELAARSDAVAAKLDADDPCGALADAKSLREEAFAAVDAGRVPSRYRSELTASVRALASSISCTTTPPIPAPAAEDEPDSDEGDDEDDEDDEDEEKKGKGEGKGKKGKRG